MGEFGRIAALQFGISLGVQAYRQSVGATLLRTGSRGVLGLASWATRVLAALVTVLAAAMPVVSSITMEMALSFGVASVGAFVQERARLGLQASRRNLTAGILALVTLLAIAAMTTGLLSAEAPAWAPWAAGGVCQLLVWSAFSQFWLGREADLLELNGIYSEWRHALSAFALQATAWASPVVALGTFSGAASVAGLRGSQTVTALGQQVPQALFPYLMARGVDRRTRKYWVALQSVVFGGLMLAFVASGNIWGPALMGDSWSAVSAVMVPTTIAAYVASLALRYEIELRLRGRTRDIFRVRRAYVAPQIVTVFVAAYVGGLVATAWVLAVGQFAVAAALSFRLRRAQS